MPLSSLLHRTETRLRAAGVDNPALDARLLVAHALQIERVDLLTQSARELSETEQVSIEKLIARREAREPVGRILGQREFWGLPFSLNEATLEPRPDSETLIEVALKLQLKGFTVKTPPLTPPSRGGDKASFRILDLGTGTGCLLLSLLHEAPEAQGTGVDLSPRACAQAKANAEQLGLASRATFHVGSWFDGINGPFDLIVSNPPYIPQRDLEVLQPEVRLFDPVAALDGGADGLEPYRFLIPQLPSYLSPQGVALFEVGQGQAEAVAVLMAQAGFENVQTHRDLGGISRCVSGFLRR